MGMMFTHGLNLTDVARHVGPWSPARLFSGSDMGLLLVAARLDLLDQSAAGGSPVTAPGQPVGLVRRAAGAVDAIQPVSAARPTLGRHPQNGIRNLAVGAQAVDGSKGHWAASIARQGVTATRVGSGIEGGLPYNDYRFTGTATTGVLNDLFYGAVPTYPSALGNQWTIRATARVIAGTLPTGSTLRTRLSYYVGETWTAGPTSPFLSDLSTDRELLLTHTHDNASVNGVRPSLSFGGGAAGSVVDVTIRIKGLQMEAGAVATPLQHNLGAYDVTEAGVESVWYLATDGIDDFLNTAAIPWGTDEVTVIAAVAKSSDAGNRALVEYSANTDANNGTFFLFNVADGAGYRGRSKGTSPGNVEVGSGWPTGATHIVGLEGKIGSDISRLRINGAQVASGSADQGAGVFGNYPLYIGARGGSSFYFQGRIYGLLAINRLLNPTELALTERWMARKCGVTLP